MRYHAVATSVSLFLLIGCASINRVHVEQIDKSKLAADTCQFVDAIAAIEALPENTIQYSKWNAYSSKYSHYQYSKAEVLEWLEKFAMADQRCRALPDGSTEELKAKSTCFKNKFSSIKRTQFKGLEAPYKGYAARCIKKYKIPEKEVAASKRLYIEEQAAAAKKEAKKQKEREAYYSSPAYNSDRLCSFTKSLKISKNALKKEREITSIGGVQNLTNTRKYASRIHQLKGWIKDERAEFKKKSGKSWSETVCKK